MRIRILFHGKRGVLLDQLAERGRQFHLVLAILQGQRHSIDWLWGRRGLDLWCAIPVDADRIAGLDVIEPAECHRVTSLGALALSCLLPEQRGYPTDAVLAVWTYYRRAIGDFAGEDACQGELAAVGRVDAFEDVSGGGSTLNSEPRRRRIDEWSL